MTMPKVSIAKLIEAKRKGWSTGKIARVYDMDARNVERRLDSAAGKRQLAELRFKKALNPTDPHYKPSEMFRTKGTSTLIDTTTGEAKLQWIKTSEDLARENAAQEAAIKVLCERVKPRKIVKRLVSRSVAALIATLYTITDAHVGALAWDKEAGEDWDLVIAEKTLTDVFLRAIDESPASALGIVNQLGDYLHFDSLIPMTPTSHHILDADSRYQKVVEVALRILMTIVEAALAKHERVQIYMHEGNHDPSGSVWLRVLFAHSFRNNPRVTVGVSPNPYTALEWGRTMLGFHHGHLTKLEKLPGIFATQYAEMWGRTKYRHVHTGHMHHVFEKEHPGVTVVQHATMAAKDAYAARGGWLSNRQATVIDYHKETGEHTRRIYRP